MSVVRVIPEASIKDGQPTGVKGTVRAADVEKVLRPTAPQQHTRPLSPAEQRKVDQNEWLPDEPNGADRLYTSDTVTIRSDRELFEEQYEKSEQERSAAESQHSAERESANRQKLANDFRTHTAHLQKMATEAKGNTASERRVAEQVRQSAALGDELKRRGIL